MGEMTLTTNNNVLFSNNRKDLKGDIRRLADEVRELKVDLEARRKRMQEIDYLLVKALFSR
jgi:hypothetical protein